MKRILMPLELIIPPFLLWLLIDLPQAHYVLNEMNVYNKHDEF